MNNLNLVAIDLAKNTFWLHGVSRSGRKIFSRKVSRRKLVSTMEKLPRCTVVVEACASSHYWTRTFADMGFDAKIVATQHVKPFTTHQKNDRNDAIAIAEVAQRKSTRFVSVKSQSQQAMCARHRVRERLVRHRTGLVNEIRSLLGEFGVIIPAGITKLRKQLLTTLANNHESLGDQMNSLILDLHSELLQLDERIARFDRQIAAQVKECPVAQRLLAIPGIGPLTASALVSQVGSPSEFKNGRHFAAYCGLVPRQHSSGNSRSLGGITKNGNKYLRKLLALAARPVLYRYARKETPIGRWIRKHASRLSYGKLVIAYANKLARIIWHLLAHPEAHFESAKAFSV